MIDPDLTSETTLCLKRTFAAPRENVFKAWTDPAFLKKWWRVQENWSTPVAEVDLRVGGKYRLGMHSPETGNQYVVQGEYRTVQPPEKLVYTWSWEGENPYETLVTVLFHDKGKYTEVELIHEQFPDREQRDKHNEGWIGCLEQLGRAL
ncbi:MAG: SRPBCC domain-containing protein [bacterium]